MPLRWHLPRLPLNLHSFRSPDQIDACAVGSLVSITSAAAYLFDKHLRVRVGRWGTVAPLPDDASLIPNLANNLSSTPLIPAGFES